MVIISKVTKQKKITFKTKHMKSSKNIKIAFGILIAFVAGFMVGITLTNPGLSLMEAAGTIGKIDKYRNIKITEADIQLKNTLLENEELREAYIQYFAYEYTANVKMLGDIELAIKEAISIPEYYAANTRNIDALEEYMDFLDIARLRILEAIDGLTNLDDRSQVAIQSILGRAGNAMAQNVMRSSVVFDFLADVERYLTKVSREAVPGLVLVHDRLFSNLLTACLVNENRSGLDFLSQRDFIGDEEFFGSVDFSSNANLSSMLNDAGNLGSFLAGSLLYNQDQLSGIVYSDMQSLGAGFSNQESLQQQIISNAQQLGFYGMITDAQQLQSIGFFDSEQLRFDSERLQLLLNSQQLQVINSQSLNSLMNSQEQLRGINAF